MSDDLMLEMYKTLRDLQYPGLTKANPSNFAATILSAENRVALLSWMLTEQVESAKETLETLTAAALQDKLVDYYTEFGICTKKESLLGTCDINKQIPTLKALLNFMKHVLLESIRDEPEPKISIDAILKTNLSEDATLLSNPQSKLTYQEALDYFASIQEELKSKFEIPEIIEEEPKEAEASETNSETQTIEKSCEERNELLFAEIESFGKFAIPKATCTARTGDSWDERIRGIHRNFSTLREVLRIKEEFAKIVVAEPITKAPTELDQLIENIVICFEEAQNS